jgi:hypothetical protein
MKQPRQYVFRYDGDAASDEEFFDMDGEMPVPAKDAIIFRKGQRWLVTYVNEEISMDKAQVPIVRVFMVKHA